MAKDLDIAEYTVPAPHPMIPHTFVLEPGLKIHKIYHGYWYWGRPSTSELHADLRDVTRKCRWDFDLGNPEVRAAWERGERIRVTGLSASSLRRSVGLLCLRENPFNAAVWNEPQESNEHVNGDRDPRNRKRERDGHEVKHRR